MVLRKCSLCDRKFSKTEHYKRHLRSHTKERPYECQTCNKRFSRSDVLFRHSKLHPQQESDARPASAGPTIDHDFSSPLIDGQRDSVSQSLDYGHNTLAESTAAQPQNDVYDRIHPSLRHLSLPEVASPYQHRNGSYTYASGISPMPNFPGHSFGTIEETPTQAFTNGSMLMDVGRPYHDVPSSNHTTDPNIHPDLQNEALASPSVLKDFDGDANDMLQFWLEHADNDADFSSLAVPEYMDHFQPQLDTLHPFPQDVMAGPDSGGDSVASIPDERFARVEECWISSASSSQDLRKRLWQGVARAAHPNIFSTCAAPHHATQVEDNEASKWGVDSEVRRRLKIEFTTAPGTPANFRPSSNPRAGGLAFPPAEVLDICLDMYFRKVHPMAPFIHIPTFKVATAPLPLLFIMCALGLSSMSTGGGTKFIKQAFPSILRKAHHQLMIDATTTVPTERRLCTFAVCFLALKLAALSTDRDYMAQSQVLYSTLLATVQRQGLSSAKEAAMSDLLPGSMALNERWQTWARMESVKRLIACLVTLDWWYSSFASASPLIRPESIDAALPADDDLFRAESPQEWLQLIERGRNVTLPIVRPRCFAIKGCLDNLLLSSHPLQAFTTFSLLSVIKHSICDAQHRYFLPTDDWDRHDHLVPWQMYKHDPRGRSLVPVTVSLAQSATASPRNKDLNMTVLWHNICMTLGANMQIFELAAGRAGAPPASKALADIADWSQTSSARRACIHASQTLKLLSNRKVSDAIMLNSMSALFASALVLALYVFTAPQTSVNGTASGESRFELMDEVEWTLVGDYGLAENISDPSDIFDASHTIPAARWIRNGGPMSIGGTAPNGGYLSARRILLDYAHLMDEMGAWKPKTYSRILHIMSDVLEDSP